MLFNCQLKVEDFLGLHLKEKIDKLSKNKELKKV